MSDNIYRRGNDILVVITEDCTGKKFSKFKSSLDNEEEVARVFNSVISKYGMKLKVVSTKEKFDWLKEDEEFKL